MQISAQMFETGPFRKRRIGQLEDGLAGNPGFDAPDEFSVTLKIGGAEGVIGYEMPVGLIPNAHEENPDQSYLKKPTPEGGLKISMAKLFQQEYGRKDSHESQKDVQSVITSNPRSGKDSQQEAKTANRPKDDGGKI